MTVLLLRKTAFIIFFCNFVITHQDFLEYYKPRPGLPKPLNDWLTYVQEHKTDFKFINNIVKRRKEEQEYYDEMETTNRNRLLENNEDEYIDEAPQNDIYPHQRQEKENSYNNFIKRSNSNRIRRESSKNSFFEHTNNLEVESNGKLGEIKRVGEKYPEQFKNKDQQGKREIQIDVLNNGKLIKSIKEADKDSKSILLNINTMEEPHNQLIEDKIDVKKSDIKDLGTYPFQNNLKSDNTKQTIIEAEKAINYNNLFTANKDLNTDSSVPKNILMYHVTLGNTDPPILDNPASENVPVHNFHQNNFKDMSKYWSDSEKHQLRKGIQFSHDTVDIKHMVKDIPKPNFKLTDGFESVKSIVVDHSRDIEPSRKIQQQYQPQVKRNLDTLQGTVKLQNDDNVVDLESSIIPLKVTVRNDLLEELSTEVHVEVTLKEDKATGDNINQELFHHHNSELPNAENINNHIDITIIQPQKEKNNEELEGNINKVQEEELKQEIAEENINKEEGKNELIKEIIREEENEEEKGHKHSEMEEESELERMNPECNQEDGMQSYKHIIGEHSHGQKKTPTVRVQVDVSRDIHNEDIAKKRNLINKRNIHNRHHNKRPFHCQGENCNTVTKDNLHNRQHVHLNKKKFNSRQLKSANYIYDVDIEAPNEEEYAEDDISSEKNQLSGINKKNAVEGDYGDEEDSVTINKNESNKIVKVSKNAFANPTVSAHEEDDDSDYYDEEAPTAKNKNHTKKSINEHTVKYRSREHTSEFGKHMHKKPKIITKSKKGNSKFEDSFASVREPRSQKSNEEFQQLPKFVMNDRIEEENLRKRSLSAKKEFAPNKFPLSSKGFFTRDSKQNEIKRSGDIIVDKSSASPIVDLATAVANNSGYNGDSTGTTLVDFGDLPAITSTTTVAPSTECEDSKVDIGHACDTESFNNNSMEITTLLSIIPDVESQMVENDTDILKPNEKFEKLDEVLSGELPNSLVNTIYDHLKNDENFKTRLYRGMKRFHEKLPITSDDIQVVTQEENRKMLNIMESIINKLEWNTNCQKIPKRLKRYLTSITRGKTHDVLTKTKQMEEVNFDDTQTNRNFLFNHEGDGATNTALTKKAKILKDMLNKFELLPADCKARAEPVKKYVEEHLLMLDHVNDLIKSQTEKTETVTEFKEVTVHQKLKRRNGQIDNDLVEEQLESLGLGKNHNFKPKFNLDDIVEKSKKSLKRNHQEGKSEKKSKRELTNEGSKQYRKLLAAVRRERIKREGKRRLAETFGKLNVDDFTGENPDNPIKDIFESPVVYIS